MPHFDDTILQAIPEPALVAVRGRIVCFNPAAADLFPGLAEHSPLPDPLPSVCDSAGLVLAGGGSWQFTATPVGEGTLYLLRAARLEGMSRAQLDGTVRRLREQMAQLLLNLQLLGQSLPEEDSNRTIRLPGMNRALCQMLRLTDQLDLLRDMESGQFRFRPVTLDLAGLCREISSGAGFLLEQIGVTLSYDSSLTSLLVNGDSELLQKLILELLVNAARAADKGGQLTLSLARREEKAILILSGPGRDDGRPLPQLLSGDIPENRIPRPGEGAGQGLVLAQRVVSLHEGTLMMERQNGIRAIVALPLAPRGASLPMRAAAGEYTGGFPSVLVGLSDLLDDHAFLKIDME